MSALAASALVVACPGTAGAVSPQELGHVDLLTQANVEIRGVVGGDSVGGSVAGAGDVNGDGIADVIVGRRPIGGRGSAGSAYVVFGRPTLGPVDLAHLDAGGFVISGRERDLVGWAVAGAGDVNADGRADVIVGAPAAAANGRTGSGSAYVVFGKATTGSVDVAALGEGGFRIDGGGVSDGAGWSVAGAGDVNADGRADVVVGAPNPLNDTRFGLPRSAAVVFGKATSASVDLGALGDGGFRMDGAAFPPGTSPVGDGAGSSVAGAGDVNGDGRADVVVGAPFADGGAGADAGSAYVVFGKATTDGVALTALGAGGLRIDGANAGGGAASSVAGAGDVNLDGRGDVIVAASTYVDGALSGAAYVVYGTSRLETIDLAALGAGGYAIGGASGVGAVAGAGDVNADGRPDVIVGSPGARHNDRADSGSSYVVFGTPKTLDVDLGALGAGGFRIDGATGQLSGGAVAGAGDVNADGSDDVLVGAPYLNTKFRGGAGSAYLVYGFGTPPVSGAPVQPAPTCEGKAATIVARTGQTRINGTAGRDVIVGSRAADRIDGRGAGDTICAGRGNDTIRGGAGNDRLVGGIGNDNLRGGAGRDRLSGNAGRDRVRGGAGDDHLDEVKFRGSGHDRLFGGNGRDRIRSADSTRDTVDCGRGRDNAIIERVDRRRGCERVRFIRRRR